MFCPQCGKNLHNNQFKFCPFCGSGLDAMISTAVTEPTDDKGSEVFTIEDVVKSYEKFVKEKRATGLPEQEIKLQAEQFVQQLKQKVNVKIVTHSKGYHAKAVDKVQSKQRVASGFHETDYYSLIIKSCLNTESLIGRLNHVLERSFIALRLAMANMPCCIIYKSKINTLAEIIEAFTKEKAAITVIPGDVIGKAEAPTASITIPANLKHYITSVPPALLQGEFLSGVYAAKFDARDGVLIIGSQNLIFVYRVQDNYYWDIVPYYLVQEVSLDDEVLEVVCRDGGYYSFEFAAEQDAEEVNLTLEKVQFSSQEAIKLRRICSRCGRSLEESVFTAYKENTCDQCGHPVHRTLIYR